MSEWVRACSRESLPPGSLLAFTHDKHRILLANLLDTVHATDLICTHAEADLSTGFLSEEGVRCPLHLSVFSLDNGMPCNPPAEDPLRVYNVKIEQDWIYVEI